MNKEVLIVINWYNSNTADLKEALKRVEEIFSNIIVSNKSSKVINLDDITIINGHTNYLFELNEYINSNKLDIKSIVFVDDIVNTTRDDIAKCAMDSIENNTAIIVGVNDDYGFGEKSINKLFNALFNTNFKSITPDIKAINIELFRYLVKTLDKQNNTNYLITAINENIPVKEENIKTIWREKAKRVGKSNFKAIPYLKTLLPYIVKSLIPYFLSLLLFIIIFYLIGSNNDLEGIIVATLVAEGVGLIAHIFINYQMVYKNNLLYRNLLFLLKKIFRIVLSCFFVYILYNILDLNLILSKILVDIVLMLLIAYFFTSATKN